MCVCLSHQTDTPGKESHTKAHIPETPMASWFRAMISLFSKIILVSAVMRVMSQPTSMGAFIIAHKLKCTMYSLVVMPPLPTSNCPMRRKESTLVRQSERGCYGVPETLPCQGRSCSTRAQKWGNHKHKYVSMPHKTNRNQTEPKPVSACPLTSRSEPVKSDRVTHDSKISKLGGNKS